MSSFVLVPGAFHGAWCFDELAARLRLAGHYVGTPNLPGIDGAASGISLTLDDWADAVADVVKQSPQPPILVGHSRGGIVISAVAEFIPDDLAETVYLAAALLPHGTVPLDGLLARMPEGTTVEQLPEFLDPPPFEVVYATAFNDCDPALARKAYSHLLPEPVAPLKHPLNLTAERFGSVPRTYIETLQDHAVTLEDQRAMQTILPCGRVLQIQSGHSPFFSACSDLVDILSEIAAQPQR